MEKRITVIHNRHKGDNVGCNLDKQSPYRTLECLKNFANTIGIDLKTAIEMGFIKNPTEEEIRQSKHKLV